MDQSESHHAEITILSAENLTINGKLNKKKTFVIVKMDPNNYLSTKVDREGGSCYPSWNEKLVVNMPMHARFFTVEVHCRTSGDHSRLIGSATVPVSDFLGGEFMPEDYLHFLSYRLRDKYGERNGIINLSVKLNVKSTRNVSAKMVPKYACSSSQAGQKQPGGVVIGVPVWSS